MSEFKEGDVVVLKSGGPKMTIHEYIKEYDEYDCVWFADDKTKYGRFKATDIEKPEPPSF